MEMSNQVVQVIDALCEKFGIVIDWTSENVIPYLSTLCDKYISYEIWTSVAWMILMLVLTIPSVIVLVKYYKTLFDFDGCLAPLGVTLIIYVAIMGFVTICCLVVQSLDIITCLTFPEKQIFEYVQSVMNAAG